MIYMYFSEPVGLPDGAMGMHVCDVTHLCSSDSLAMWLLKVVEFMQSYASCRILLAYQRYSSFFIFLVNKHCNSHSRVVCTGVLTPVLAVLLHHACIEKLKTGVV